MITPLDARIMRNLNDLYHAPFVALGPADLLLVAAFGGASYARQAQSLALRFLPRREVTQ